MLADSVRSSQRGQGRFYDAEHFFDGFSADRDYALSCAPTVNAGVRRSCCATPTAAP